MSLPYHLLPLVAALWLTVRHCQSALASARSKRVVCVLTGVSVLASGLWPLGASLLQLAICGYVVLHQTVTPPEDSEIKGLPWRQPKSEPAGKGN